MRLFAATNFQNSFQIFIAVHQLLYVHTNMTSPRSVLNFYEWIYGPGNAPPPLPFPPVQAIVNRGPGLNSWCVFDSIKIPSSIAKCDTLLIKPWGGRCRVANEFLSFGPASSVAGSASPARPVWYERNWLNNQRLTGQPDRCWIYKLASWSTSRS